MEGILYSWQVQTFTVGGKKCVDKENIQGLQTGPKTVLFVYADRNISDFTIQA